MSRYRGWSQGPTPPAKATDAPTSSKYRAVPEIVNGIRFSSKMEARFYRYLDLLQKSGEIAAFHRQVIVDLGGGVRHVIDFLVLRGTEPFREYYDVKGYDVPATKAKRKIAESILRERIIVVDRRKLAAMTKGLL